MSMCTCEYSDEVQRDLVISIIKHERLTLEQVAVVYPHLRNTVAYMKADLPELVG